MFIADRTKSFAKQTKKSQPSNKKCKLIFKCEKYGRFNTVVS